MIARTLSSSYMWMHPWCWLPGSPTGMQQSSQSYERTPVVDGSFCGQVDAPDVWKRIDDIEEQLKQSCRKHECTAVESDLASGQLGAPDVSARIDDIEKQFEAIVAELGDFAELSGGLQGSVYMVMEEVRSIKEFCDSRSELDGAVERITEQFDALQVQVGTERRGREECERKLRGLEAAASQAQALNAASQQQIKELDEELADARLQDDELRAEVLREVRRQIDASRSEVLRACEQMVTKIAEVLMKAFDQRVGPLEQRLGLLPPVS